MASIILRTRFGLRLFLAFLKKHRNTLILGGLVALLSFIILPKIIIYSSKSKPEKIALVGKFTLDKLPQLVLGKLSQGLTTTSSEGKITPLLAESWRTENEGKEYIFTLKSNLYWQDGKPVKAKDIDYNFSDVAVSPLSDKEIKFILKEAFTPFPSILVKPVFKKGLVGTGGYKVSVIKTNGQIVEKISLVPVKKRTKPKIIYNFYPTEETARTAFKLGEVDSIEELNFLGDLEWWKTAKYEKAVRFDRFVAIFFNTQKLGDKSFRQALAYSLKKNWEPRVLTPINHQSWAYNPSVKDYAYDLENAKKLLEKSQKMTELTLSSAPSLLPFAEEIKNDWQALGINIKIKVFTSLDEDFDALLITQEVPIDPDQYVFWHSTQQMNISRLISPKIDNLLEEGRKMSDETKRLEIYQDFQRFLVEETAAVFLFNPTVYTVSRI